MAHFRKTIRDEIKSRIATLTGVDSEIADSRGIAINAERMPVAFATFADEEPTDKRVANDGTGEVSRRVLTASVGVCCTGVGELDDLSEELELRMSPEFVSGVTHSLEAVQFSDPERGEKDIFSIALRIEFSYLLDQRSPDVLAD